MTIVNSDSVEVQQWMVPTVHTVAQDGSIRCVLTKMSEHRISALPVVDQDDRVVGIVTIGDLARVVLETDKILESDYPHYEDCFWAVDLIQKRLGSDEVTRLMSEIVATVGLDTTMHQAAIVMSNQHVRHLPVVNSHGKLVGMLSANDFVRMLAHK